MSVSVRFDADFFKEIYDLAKEEYDGNVSKCIRDGMRWFLREKKGRKV